MRDFKGRHFEGTVILGCIRWYCKYGISYRNLEEMMLERGVDVDHSTLYRWVQKYAPEMERRLQWHRKGRSIGTWQLDETYIKVKGVWKYLYRAIDSKGNTLDFYLSHTRNTKAAYRFLRKVLGKFKSYEQPTKINTDKNPSYGAALKLLKKEGKCNTDIEHRQVKYMNNRVESDHGKLKRRINPGLGFQKMKTALATIKGYEVMRMFEKKQFDIWMGFPETKLERLQREIRLVQNQFYF